MRDLCKVQLFSPAPPASSPDRLKHTHTHFTDYFQTHEPDHPLNDGVPKQTKQKKPQKNYCNVK